LSNKKQDLPLGKDYMEEIKLPTMGTIPRFFYFVSTTALGTDRL